MNINTQAPEKADRRDDGSVVVHSIFYTIQGEGPFAGDPAVFVRLAGCNLQCPMCDTEYTQQRLRMDPDHVTREIYDAITERAQELKTVRPIPEPLVVITGGEPFRQNIKALVLHLLAQGMRVQIETNGTLYPGEGFPFHHTRLRIVCSPKTSAVHKKLVPYVDAFKYVATAASLWACSDGLPKHALEHPNAKGLFRPPADWAGTIYLQPVDEQDVSKNAVNRAAVVESCMKHGYRLCLQLHKIIGLD